MISRLLAIACIASLCALSVEGNYGKVKGHCSCVRVGRLQRLLNGCLAGGNGGGNGGGTGNGGNGAGGGTGRKGLGTGKPDPGTTRLVVYNGVVTWYEAANNCKDKGGQLGVPRTLREIRDMNTQAKARGRQLWMGGDDQRNEGNWVDVNGHALVELNFAPGQPDSHRAENCLCLYFYTLERSWNDCVCKAHLRGYVCRLPK